MAGEHRIRITLETAYTPIVWGTSYWVITEMLPPGRPFLAAAGRALPAGVLLVLLLRRVPPPGWRLRVAVLAFFNIGLFFSLLFVGAERLPGGVAATAGALGPLIVLFLAWPLLRLRPTAAGLLCGVGGVGGVAALVLGPAAALDATGVAAAIGGTASLATGLVLGRRWGPPPMPLLAFTAWQLLAGGALITPVALIAEGTPPVPTARNLAGFAVIGIAGTAVAYALWFRGIVSLPAPALSFLALLSPIVATTIGWLALDQSLTAVQIGGAVLVFVSIVIGQIVRTQRPAAGLGRRDAGRRSVGA